jgi:hypothetical protein
MITSLLLPRTAIALVWLYQGFWCKLLDRAPHHQKIVETVPFLNSSQARQALMGLITIWRHRIDHCSGAAFMSFG